MSYECLIVERDEAVTLIRFNRPQALNAFNHKMMEELAAALDAAEADDSVHCIIITGSERAFAAGADIKEMASKDYVQAYREDLITRSWERVARLRKPVIAAVAGYALGGGCELAMMCDFIIAADNAKLGQPEITLGLMPGAGGTQRLTRFAGKSKAMDLILTGRMMEAAEAERAGLVARVVPAGRLLEEALAAAKKIAEMPPVSVMLAKEMVNAAYETTLHEGVRAERRAFYSLFALEDSAEGMAAFVEKRKPGFKGR
jgi:enoyl-CoA hydratase/carnithine racemase